MTWPSTPTRRRSHARAEVFLALALALLAGAVPSSVAAQAVRVEGITAVVGAHGNATVILRSEVTLRARITLSGGSDASVAFVPIPRELWTATLEQMIGEVLIAREAERLRVAPPTDADVAAERARLETDAGSPERLGTLARALGATAEELDAIARRRAQVAAFLRANLEDSAIVTDAEVERAYAAGGHPFAELPLEQAREPLRALLGRQAIERAVRRWVALLRTRTEVRIVDG